MSAEAIPLDNTTIYLELEKYPWDKDKEFQVRELPQSYIQPASASFQKLLHFSLLAPIGFSSQLKLCSGHATFSEVNS